MKEAVKWVIATVAVLTLPLWIVPAITGYALWKGIRIFKNDVIDGGGVGGD